MGILYIIKKHGKETMKNWGKQKHLGKFDHDLTATSLESWLIRELVPKWP